MNDGGAYSIYHSTLGLLEQGAEVKILAMDLLKSKVKADIPPDFKSVTRLESVEVDNRPGFLKAMKNLFSTKSYLVERFYSSAYEDKLREILLQEQFDIVQIEHLYLGLYIGVIRNYSKAAIVLRPQNVEHQLWQSNLLSVKNPVLKFLLSVATKRLENFENNIIVQVDGIMPLSPNDAEYFRQNAVRVPVAMVPIGIDPGRFLHYQRSREDDRQPEIYHLGSMDWMPNVTGLKWFIGSCWPLLKKLHPSMRLSVAGKNMPSWFRRRSDKNLEVQSLVDNALDFQRDKDILIVPLLSGSGTRVKILEAMALGKAIVSTSIGAQGIAYENGVHILIADSPSEFVQQLGRCMASRELCEMLGNNARELISHRYGLSRTGQEMIRFHKKITAAELVPIL